jgi:outer membrane protein TolC
MLTLEDAIAIALANNYDILLSRNDSAVAALDYEYRNVVFYPRLNANAGTSWTKNNQKQEFTDGTGREGNVATNNLNASLALNWTLFDGLRMFATKQKVEEYMHLGELIIKNQVINTVADVVITYYSIVREKQQLRAIEEQMSISQTRVELAQRKLEIGVGAKPDVLQSKVDLNAQRAAQLQQQTLIRQLKETLNQLLQPSAEGAGSSMSTDYDVSDSIEINTTLSLEEIRNGVEQNNPLLQISNKNIDIAFLTLEELKADRFPKLDFNATYNFTRVNNDIALNPFLPIFNRNRGLNYGFTLTVPILNYRNTHRLIEQQELNIGFQRLLLENQKSLLRLDVQNAYHDFELQQQALALEEENILLARENVEIILETYRLGSVTYIQLREAQQSLEDAYTRLIAARYNTKVAETELLRLKGELVR